MTLYGAAADRTPTLMFNVAAARRAEVAAALAAARDRGLARQLLRLGARAPPRPRPDGAVRAGFVHYNDEADAERLLAAVSDLA